MSFKSGDIIAVSGKGPVSWIIEGGTLALPNIGPLGRLGYAGFSHVGIVVEVYDKPLVYESTSFPRPKCVRTGRENPTGVQAHWIPDILNAGGDVWHFSLRCPLYEDEQERLLVAADELLGVDYDFIGAGRAWGGLAVRAIHALATMKRESMKDIFCSEYVGHLHAVTGVMPFRNASTLSPQWLIRRERWAGVIGPGRLIS